MQAGLAGRYGRDHGDHWRVGSGAAAAGERRGRGRSASAGAARAGVADVDVDLRDDRDVEVAVGDDGFLVEGVEGPADDGGGFCTLLVVASIGGDALLAPAGLGGIGWAWGVAKSTGFVGDSFFFLSAVALTARC